MAVGLGHKRESGPGLPYRMGPVMRQAMTRLPLQAIFCLTFALATRAHVFGDPLLHVDDNWYLTVGDRLLHGDRLYVDIWDRKPPGLFLLYALAAALPHPVLGFQIMAWLFASATALLVLRMAQRAAGPVAAWIAAVLYLSMLVQLGGAGGQSPVFYNLPMAGAAMLVGFREPQRPWRAPLAILLASLAVTIKPTALFESLFFAGWALWQERRRGATVGAVAARALVLAAVGALPAIAIAGWFLAHGHFAALWQATVLSNFVRAGQMADPERLHRLLLTLPVLAFAAGSALLALVLGRDEERFARVAPFLGGWIAAALVGVLAVPNFYDHYLLPLTVPLAIAGAGFLNRSRLLLLAGSLGALSPLLEAKPWDFARTREQASAYARMTRLIRRADPHPRLFVLEGPPLLYATFDVAPLTPLSFPQHLDYAFERNVSGIDTAREVTRILAQRPTTIVTSKGFSSVVANLDTRAKVDAYIAAHCPLAGEVEIAGWNPGTFQVFSRCR